MGLSLPGIRVKKIYWGWYVVFGAFMIMILTYGVRYSFGVFVKPMFAEYNWPMTVIQLGASINLFVYALACILTGWLLDRVVAKWVMIAGILATTSGLVLASHIQTPLGLYLSYGVLVGAGTAGCGMVVNTVSVGKWFNRYRGLALGISSMGIGIGTMLMAPLAGYLVKYYGWRNGFLFMGMLLLLVGVLISSTLMGKRGPEQIGLLPDGDTPESQTGMPDASAEGVVKKISLKPVLKSGQFWLIAVCNILAVMTVMMTFNCQIAYAINRGINELEAAAALGLIGLTGSIGKFFFGWLCDRVTDAKIAASTGFVLMAIGMILLYQTKTVTALYLFAFVYGFGYGSVAPVTPYILSDRFGRQVFGSAYGLMIFFAAGCGGSIGPLLGGIIFDRTGSYSIGWLFNVAILLLVAVAVLFLGPKESKTV